MCRLRGASHGVVICYFHWQPNRGVDIVGEPTPSEPVTQGISSICEERFSQV